MNPILAQIIGGLVGLVLGVGIVLLFNHWRNK